MKKELQIYEQTFTEMTKSEAKLKINLEELKSQKHILSKKLKKFDSFTSSPTKDLSPQLMDAFNEKVCEDNLNNSDVFTITPTKAILKSDQSDENSLLDDSVGDGERNSLHVNNMEKLQSVETKSGNNKYYKKYMKYRSMANDLHQQVQSIKSKAVASMVEKEKRIMKLTQENEINKSKVQEMLESTPSGKSPSSASDAKGLKRFNTFSSTNFDNCDGESDLISKVMESKNDYLKQQLRDLQAEKDNSVRKLGLDFQNLASKYEEDISYYKDMISHSQERPSINFIPVNYEDPMTPLAHDDKVIEELRENEEHYAMEEKKYKTHIAELEAKIVDLEDIIDIKNSKPEVRLEGPKEVDDDVQIQLDTYQEQVISLKDALRRTEDTLAYTKKELKDKTTAYDEADREHDQTIRKLDQLHKNILSSHEEVKQWKEKYSVDIETLKDDLLKKTDFYNENMNSMKLELKNKESLITTLTQQIENDDFDDSKDNPFGPSQGTFEDASLFDELGGASTARSFSLIPSNYKNLAIHLKKRFKVLEVKLLNLKSENKTLLDQRASFDQRLEIAEKESRNYKAQVDEFKKKHEKETKSMHNQIRAAHSELQKMKKSSHQSSTSYGEEVTKWKQK